MRYIPGRPIPRKHYYYFDCSLSAELRILSFDVFHDLKEGFLIWISGSHAQINASGTDPYLSSYFQQLQTYRMALSFGELSSSQDTTSEFIHKHISKRRKIKPQLISLHHGRRGTISKQIKLLLFDPVLHISPGTI